MRHGSSQISQTPVFNPSVPALSPSAAAAATSRRYASTAQQLPFLAPHSPPRISSGSRYRIRAPRPPARPVNSHLTSVDRIRMRQISKQTKTDSAASSLTDKARLTALPSEPCHPLSGENRLEVQDAAQVQVLEGNASSRTYGIAFIGVIVAMVFIFGWLTFVNNEQR